MGRYLYPAHLLTMLAVFTHGFADNTPPDKIVPTLRVLVRKLPEYNRYSGQQLSSRASLTLLLRFLWKEVNKFLFDLSKHSDVNMMTPQNIGIVIGPNVLWQVRRKIPFTTRHILIIPSPSAPVVYASYGNE